MMNFILCHSDTGNKLVVCFFLALKFVFCILYGLFPFTDIIMLPPKQ